MTAIGPGALDAFDEDVAGPVGSPHAGQTVVLAELEETEDAYLVELLPGAPKEEVELFICGRCLTVSGRLSPPDGSRPGQGFRYELLLPGDVDAGDVQASLRGGALRVRAAKACAARPRRIRLP